MRTGEVVVLVARAKHGRGGWRREWEERGGVYLYDASDVVKELRDINDDDIL